MNNQEFTELTETIQQAKRILVLGPPGAGKSTFAKKLSVLLNSPLHHLDDEYWLPGWERIDFREWQTKLHLICSKPSWIIDGNHANTYSLRSRYADLVIILNYNRCLCLWRYTKRSLLRYCQRSNDLPKNIQRDPNYRPKISIQWHLIKLILCYSTVSYQTCDEGSGHAPCRVVTFSNEQQTNSILRVLNLETIEGHDV